MLDAAEQLNYRPNREASALRRMGGAQILVLELKREARDYWTDVRTYSWFFADAVRSIMTSVHGSLYYMTLDTWHVNEDPAPIIAKHSPAGILCFDIENTGEAEQIRSFGLPYVISWHAKSFTGFNRVISDNYHGGYLAGEYLRNTAHVRPLYITAPSYNPEVHESRMQGFCDAFDGREVTIVHGSLGKEGGYESGRSIVDKIRQRHIDSIGVVNDITAMGVAQALMDAGIRIPEDVSLVGYDNMPVNIALPFRLTTIDIEIGELYRKATHALLTMLKDGGSVELSHPPRLLTGESVAAPR